MTTFNQQGQHVQIQNNAGNDIHISGGVNISSTPMDDAKALVNSIREWLPEAPITETERIEAAAYLNTIEGQAESSAPAHPLIKFSLDSLKGILEKAVAGIVVAEAAPQVHTWIQQINHLLVNL